MNFRIKKMDERIEAEVHLEEYQIREMKTYFHIFTDEDIDENFDIDDIASMIVNFLNSITEHDEVHIDHCFKYKRCSKEDPIVGLRVTTTSGTFFESEYFITKGE